MANDEIKIHVRFFAAPREAVNARRVEKQLSVGATVAELIDRLVQDYPVLRTYTPYTKVAVNHVIVSRQTELHDGDEVACLPPVGGG